MQKVLKNENKSKIHKKVGTLTIRKQKKTILKMDKYLNSHYTKEDTQMTNMFRKDVQQNYPKKIYVEIKRR